MHFVSETSNIIVSVMHRLTMAAKLDSSLHLIYLRHLTHITDTQNENQIHTKEIHTFLLDPLTVVGKNKIQNSTASWAGEEKHQFMRNLALTLFLQLLPFGQPVAAVRPCSSELMTSSQLHTSTGKSAPISKLPVLKSLYV